MASCLSARREFECLKPLNGGSMKTAVCFVVIAGIFTTTT